MWHIWIDTGGTFTDGMAHAPNGQILRTKVLSSSCLRARLNSESMLEAPWLTAPIFDGYQLRVLETGQITTVRRLGADGQLATADALERSGPVTVELSTGEEAPVLAARLLTQTPLDQPFPVLEMRLGTTKGTNALLERKGGRVVLLVTAGFRDLLQISTQQRPNLFQLDIPPAERLHEAVLEVPERMAANGAIVQPLSPETIQHLIQQLTLLKPDAVAVSLLNAYRNPIHEQQLGEALAKAGFVVTLSTQISSAIQYLPRTQTAVVDAYLTPVLRSYLTNLVRQLGGHPVRVMTSAGGLVKADLFQPKDSLLSGPAGGVIGAAAVASATKVLTLDMGGTSTDVARYDGQVDYRFLTRIGSFELQSPSLAVETVAAGGGSVCWFEKSGATSGQLRVGPHSAGASPGPACYGAGGPLTITDVNLLLGRLHPARFGIPVSLEKAQEALQAVRQAIEAQTGETLDEEALLRGFLHIADEAMAGAIRKISVARGFDPQEYALLAFGGAGGLHGCSVARLLAIKTLFIPFDGGLLSAYGIGKARIERLASRQVLQPLSQAKPHLADWLEVLAQTATTDLQQDLDGPAAGGSTLAGPSAVEVRNQLLFVRLQGQETTLEVPYTADSDESIEARFRTLYQQRYGHFPANRAIEVESLRVIVSTQQPAPLPPTSAGERVRAEPSFATGLYPVYDWMALQEGHTLAGPALLLNATSSAFIDSGWTVTIGSDRNAVAQFTGEEQAPETPLLDVAQTELFARRFTAIAEEMGAQLQRTAFSVNVKERLDFSCALLDANAELLVNAPHIPVHLGSLGVCARLVLDRLPLGPGDVVITNHPRYGGSHLPDVTLLRGVFTEDDQLIGYVINRAHHAEIGGKVPGSMPPDATRLIEEGVVLEPQYVVREGVFLLEELEKRFTTARYPTRAWSENRADVEAALASLRAGESALQALVQQHGFALVQRYMQQLKQASTNALLSRLADGRTGSETVRATESLDDGHLICVAVTLEPDQITFDFSGTSPVHPNNLNANVSILYSAILYVLRLWCEREVPLNEGLMAPVKLILPECFLNPSFSDDPADCPAVVGGNTEVSQRLVDTLLKALEMAACSQGTMNNFLFGNEQFGYYETICGGVGAGPGFAGRSAVHQHMTNTKLTDPEELERRYPVRLHQFGIRAGSGGRGRWNGGDGIVREVEFLAPVQVTLLSQHRVVAPYGLAGGEPGQTGRQTLVQADGTEAVLPGIFTRPMQPGERIRIETPGGGGYGPNGTD